MAYIQPEVAPPGHGDQVATPQVRHLMRDGVCHHEVPAAGHQGPVAGQSPCASG